MVIITTGVAGSGKTTIGRLLADNLGLDFYDADDFHPPANVAKMRSGTALTDADREPWLQALSSLIEKSIVDGRSIVLACSALKASYRERLRAAARPDPEAAQLVYLRITPSTAAERLNERQGHFMPATLIESQFETLEEPTGAIVVDATMTPAEIVAAIRRALK